MPVTIPTSVGPVTLKEMYEGYEPGMDIQKGPYINKLYLVSSWNQAFAAVNALVGSGSRPVQHACPESPNLRCMSAVVKPRGEYDARDAGHPQFNMPVIACTYAVPTWEALTTDDPTGSQSFPDEANPGQPYLFMEQSIDWDTEIIKLPGRAYKFNSDGMVNDTPVNIPLPTAKFVLVRRWQTTLPYTNVTTYQQNPLNSTTFLGQSRGLIRFVNARTRRQFQSDGTRSQEVEYTFKWRAYDHNAQARPDTGAFDILVTSGGANPFGYSDLNNLLS